MSETILTYPTSENLVDVAVLRRELRLGDDMENVLPDMVQRVSGLIEDYCRRSFARAEVTESLPGYGSPYLALSRTPIVYVTAVVYDSSPITDYVVEDADAGILYRNLGWTWTREVGWYLGPAVFGRQEHPDFFVTYTAGYLMPDDDVVSQNVSVLAADKSFNLTGASFPLLVPGDRIVSSGFTTAANNGTWTVVTRTAAKVTVSESGLQNEAADPNCTRTLRVRTLPPGLMQAAIDAAKARYIGRARDPGVSSRSITGLSVSYAGANAPVDSGEALPPLVIAALSKWRRYS